MGLSSSAYGKKRYVYRVLVGKLEGKGQLVGPSHKLEDNIIMDLHEMKCGGMDIIPLAQDMDKRLSFVNSVMIYGIQKMRGIT